MARIFWSINSGLPMISRTSEARKQEIGKYFPGEIITGTHVEGRFLSKKTITDKRSLFYSPNLIAYQDEDKIYEFFSGEYIGTIEGEPNSLEGIRLLRKPYNYQIAKTTRVVSMTGYYLDYKWDNISEITATQLNNMVSSYIDYKDQVAEIMRNRIRMYDEEIYSKIKREFDENNEKNRLEKENEDWIENFINNR